jgi:hypothetical protein
MSKVKRITEIGTSLAVTSNFLPKRRFLQESHGITSYKTAFLRRNLMFTFSGGNLACKYVTKFANMNKLTQGLVRSPDGNVMATASHAQVSFRSEYQSL